MGKPIWTAQQMPEPGEVVMIKVPNSDYWTSAMHIPQQGLWFEATENSTRKWGGNSVEYWEPMPDIDPYVTLTSTAKENQ